MNHKSIFYIRVHLQRPGLATLQPKACCLRLMATAAWGYTCSLRQSKPSGRGCCHPEPSRGRENPSRVLFTDLISGPGLPAQPSSWCEVQPSLFFKTLDSKILFSCLCKLLTEDFQKVLPASSHIFRKCEVSITSTVLLWLEIKAKRTLKWTPFNE